MQALKATSSLIATGRFPAVSLYTNAIVLTLTDFKYEAAWQRPQKALANLRNETRSW